MKAFNISFTLICEECGAKMRHDDNSDAHPGRMLWQCANKDCTEYEKMYSQQLPQVNLSEVVQ